LAYDSSLLCDRAAVVTIANRRGPVAPYTTAETMDAGWCWDIPVRRERHRGYVFCSQMIDDEAAVEELRRREPDMGDPWFVSFRSGRRDRFWAKNVVAMGNAYGFVEPLESTALHMVIVQIGYLLAGLEARAGGDRDYPRFASETVGRHWDYLRWFLALHYRFNHRRDTEFWRRARSEVEIGALAPVVERYRQSGPFLDTQGLPNPAHDPAFGFSGVMMMLLGQGLATPAPQTVIDEARWRERVRRQRAVVKWALPQRQTLDALDANPALLEALTGPASWCMTEAERVELGGREQLAPRSGHSRGRSPHDGLLESLR
jgi:tryptophan halogenase